VLSFLALPVVPELKLTDMGLVDVEMAQFLEPVRPWPTRRGRPLGLFFDPSPKDSPSQGQTAFWVRAEPHLPPPMRL